MAWIRRLVVLAVVIAACGDGAMTVDEYFTEFETARIDFTQANDDIDSAYQTQLDASFAELQREFDAQDQAEARELAERSINVGIDATVSLVTARVESLERYLSQLEELRPPEQAAEAHAASLVALREAREGLEPTVTAIRGIEGLGDLGSTVGASPVGQALVRAAEACRVLQGVATSEGLIIDLRCPN